jgi:hypothetical protein
VLYPNGTQKQEEDVNKACQMLVHKQLMNTPVFKLPVRYVL